MSSGQIPSEWKKARVIPLYKKGNPGNPSNHRPISVLSICMKLFEKLIHSQLYQHLYENNVLNEF